MEKGQLKLFDYDDYSLFNQIESEFFPDENYEIEYKSGKGGFPKELWKTYSAFANTNTGIIVIGVKEKKNTLEIQGLDAHQIEKYKKEFWNGCNNPNTVSKNLLDNKDVKVIEVKGRNLLAIRVPFAPRTDRPVFLTRNPFGNTYKRNHEGDYRCTDEEIRRMIADSSAQLKRDSLILEHFTLEDLDPTSLKQFRQLFKSSYESHPWHALSDLELLKKIGGYRHDRKTGIEGVTLAGLLMFGNYQALKDQEASPNFFPEYREHLSADSKIRWTDRIYPDGTWDNNLLQFYLKVWPKLSATLPKPFQLRNEERIDETPAHIALREAFVNALVHADYAQSGNIIIELDKEQFVFSNPGTLLISIEQYYTGGISECRNPSLQQMFMFMGRAEKAGSGVDKIMEGWDYTHWRRPFVDLESQPDRVKLTLPMFNIISDDTFEELTKLYEDLSQLSPDELTVLSTAYIEDSISNRRMQFMLDKHPVDITALLKKMCDEGYLESDNNGRWTVYKLHHKVATSNRKVDTSDRKVATSDEKVGTSTETVDNHEGIKRRVDTSSRKVDTSGRKVDTSKVGARLSRVDLENFIMEVCKTDYLKMEEVARIIGKSDDYLKNKIFPRMIKEGKLEKRYPFTHNHPEQGYKTKEED